MKHIIILIILLLLIPLALGDTKKIHDDWHPYHDFFTIDDDYYEVTNTIVSGTKYDLVKTLIQRNQAKFILTASVSINDDGDSFVKAQDCKEDGYYTYCIGNISLDPADGARSDEYGRYQYGTRIVIYHDDVPAADLVIDKDISEETLALGERTRVTLRITNEGDETAEDVQINESIGEGLVINRFSDFDYIIGNKLQKHYPFIFRGEEMVLNYWISATDYVNTTYVNTSIDYKGPLASKSAENSKIKITWPFTAKMKFDKKEVKIDKKARLTFEITNHEEESMNIIFNADFPKNLYALPLGKVTSNDNSISYDGMINKDEKLILETDFISPYTGEYNVSAHALLTVKDEEFNWQDNIVLPISHDMISPNLYPSKEKMRAGEPITITLYLENEDDKTSFVNLKGWMATSFFNDSFTLDKIGPDISENVIFKTYRPPATTEPITHTISVRGTFNTGSGQTEEFYTEKEFLVIPANQSIIHYHKIDKDEAALGEEITVTVTAENIADSGYKVVTVSDAFDNKLQKTFGSTTADAHLFGGEERQLYVYKILVPYDWTENQIKINSQLLVHGKVISNIDKIVEVTNPLTGIDQPPSTPDEPDTPETPDEPDTPTTPDEPDTPGTPENNTTETPGEPGDNNIAIEEENFFDAFINAIVNFFANFFS